MRTFLTYLLIGFMISTYNGNLDTKFDTAHKVKAVLYWPAYAVNYVNAITDAHKLKDAEVEKINKEVNKF